MNRVFFHIHIWKTAGTTFLNICQENFGYAFRRDVMLVQDWFLSDQQLRWLLNYHDWLQCYSCHMLSGELPFDTEKMEVVGIAFVRNPVNRFVSSYNFQRGATYRGGIARNNSFDAFYTNALVERDNPMWRNGQTHILGGSRTESGLGRIAERVKHGQIILLPMERFDECCILLERLFPEDFKDCSYTRANVSNTKMAISESQYEEIAGYMHIDFKLLEMANAYLDATLARLLPGARIRRQHVEDFTRRCAIKQRRKQIARVAGKIERTVKKTLDKVVDLF